MQRLALITLLVATTATCAAIAKEQYLIPPNDPVEGEKCQVHIKPGVSVPSDFTVTDEDGEVIFSLKAGDTTVEKCINVGDGTTDSLVVTVGDVPGNEGDKFQ